MNSSKEQWQDWRKWVCEQDNILAAKKEKDQGKAMRDVLFELQVLQGVQ